MRADRLHREAVPQRDMVADLVDRRPRQVEARRVGAAAMAERRPAGSIR